MNETVYNDLARMLTEVESSTSPCGFHGQLTGMWCRYKKLPEDLALDEVNRQTGAWQELFAFGEAVKRALEDPACTFEALLPPDSADLDVRIEAISDWAAGLLFGVGSAGKLDTKSLSEDVQELLRDLSEICKITVDEDTDGAEEAYTEIVEYLKVAAQTLYVELHPQAS